MPSLVRRTSAARIRRASDGDLALKRGIVRTDFGNDALERQLVAPGGLRTARLQTGQQWDAPTGWAPLQLVAIDGLEGYGQKELAKDIAKPWLRTVHPTYRENGKMLEKYDLEERLPGDG